MNVGWIKCEGGHWCNLLALNLNHEHFDNMEGVYIVWHSGQNPATVRVGQGFIKDRLSAHCNDPEILKYKQDGIYVTWARVAASQRDGVEKFVAEALNPKIGDRFPDVSPIEVNLPW